MKNSLLCLLFLSSVLAVSQEGLYMPIEFQQAYKNGSRSLDGKPGEAYWQNSSSYNITAEVLPGQWKIKATQQIVYKNNSPDTLRKLVIKTYANHYRKGSARANSVPLENLTDGIKVSNFKIDGMAIDVLDDQQVQEHSTFFVVNLSKAILPRSEASLSMDWEVSMPLTYVNRIGAYDEHSAFIGYWYPQIAVYDDIDGWDTNEYLGSQEFYTDLNSFDIEIKAPSEFGIWSTGQLKNKKSTYDNETLKLLEKSDNNEDFTIIPYKPLHNNVSEYKIWKFEAKHVRDFAFAVSNNFIWLNQTVQGKQGYISSNLILPENYSEQARKIMPAQKASLEYLESKLPAIPYPHEQFTTFIGVTEFDGMEFPMMANNGISAKEAENADVTFHELAHTYFPFMLGINEVKYAWMEEGWASYLTIKFIQDYYKDQIDENTELNRVLGNYLNLAGKQFDVPLFVQSNQSLMEKGQALLAYKKPAFMYFALEDFLGESVFKTCIKEYFKRWSGKHAMPYDFMFTFNEVSGQDLNWFWNAWIFNYGYMDLGIKKYSNSKIEIENVGRLPIPISLQLKYKNGEIITIEKSPEVWKENNIVEIEIEIVDGLKTIELLIHEFPDIDKSNNLHKVSN